jgi:hypothetical protein
MVDPLSVLGGVASNAIFDSIKSWLGLGDSSETSIDQQAGELVSSLPDQMEDTEELKQGLRAQGSYEITRETEAGGPFQSDEQERKVVDFDITLDSEEGVS